MNRRSAGRWPGSLRQYRRPAAALSLAALAFFASPCGARLDAPLSGFTVDGGHFSLGDERGRVVLVTFWATWCTPCRKELPMIDGFYRAHHREGFDVLAISLDKGISRERLSEVTKALSFPVARMADMQIPPDQKPASLPVTRIYDRSGRLRFDSTVDGSSIDPVAFSRMMLPLIAEQNDPR